MYIEKELRERLVRDLGLEMGFIKGRQIQVRNCWHFSTDGNRVDAMFMDDVDFRNGMNRIFVLSGKYRIVVLAFSLMDTHVHFILYGEFDVCSEFVHEYVRRTSLSISKRYGEKHKLEKVPIHYQVIDNDYYLKVAICYVYKNAPVSGIPFTAYDYPWSSCPLLFRRQGYWTFPGWQYDGKSLTDIPVKQRREMLGTRESDFGNRKMYAGIVWPEEYVANDVVEKIFRTVKTYNYFMCTSKEFDVESKGGLVSFLSLPMQEMRQHKTEFCQRMFGVDSVRGLDASSRIKLARTLKSRFNSSPRQISRLCGLVYDEVKNLL